MDYSENYLNAKLTEYEQLIKTEKFKTNFESQITLLGDLHELMIGYRTNNQKVFEIMAERARGIRRNVMDMIVDTVDLMNQ